MKALGHVFKYGDNVDTDVIIPARYLNSFDGKELASHAMVDIDPEFAKKVKPGDMIVANNLKQDGAGFGGNTNIVTLITKDDEVQLEKMTKDEVAEKIFDFILSR